MLTKVQTATLFEHIRRKSVFGADAASHAKQQKVTHQSSGSPKLGKVAAGSTPWWLRLCIANTHRASCMRQHLRCPPPCISVESRCAKAACCWLRCPPSKSVGAGILSTCAQLPPPRRHHAGCLHDAN